MTQIELIPNESLTGKWKLYPAYKDSGVEWLGEIPDLWGVSPVWTLFILGRGRVISNLGIQDNPGQYPVYSSQTENNGVLGYISTYDFDGTYLTWTTDGAKAGTVFYRQGKFNCTNVCGTLLPKDHNNDIRFFRYALNIATSWFVRHDINPKLMNGVMARIRIQVPPPQEQRTIASFLDRETSRINTLIAKKERLIELLQEKRSALISHAVTKGLDPTVQMKDSGVEWIGEIPAHWEVKRLKYVIQNGLANGLFKKKDQFGSGTKLVNVADLYRDNCLIDFDSLDRVVTEQDEYDTFKVSSGDIFFVRSSLKLEGVGSSASIIEVPEPTVFECHIVRIRPSSKLVISKYLINYLNASLVRYRLVALAETTTMTTIAQPKLASLEVLVPPISEQNIIASYLKHETANIDALISRVREGIEKLKEYSTALISAAVTGKIDVRGKSHQ